MIALKLPSMLPHRHGMFSFDWAVSFYHWYCGLYGLRYMESKARSNKRGGTGSSVPIPILSSQDLSVTGGWTLL